MILATGAILVYRTSNFLIAAWITRDGTLDPAVYESAIRYDPKNADYHFVLAQIYHYSTAYLNPRRAREEYETAARLNPDRAGHWMELSKYDEQAGDTARSRYAMQMALEKDPHYAQTHWAAANFYLRIGDLEVADTELRRTADLDMLYLEQVLDLAWRFYEDPQKMMAAYVPNTKDGNLIALNFFVAKNSQDGATRAWDRLRTFKTTVRDRFPYVDYLVWLAMPHTAWDIFSFGGSAETSNFFNSGFESEPMNDAFDWRFMTWENAKARRDPTLAKNGHASFVVVFNGKENVDYNHLWHWVPAQKGATYNLRFWMKTDAISTDEGMFVEVEGNRSEKQIGSNDWHEFTVPFTASADLVTVRLCRVPSRKLDNLLKGKVWVDAFSLRERP